MTAATNARTSEAEASLATLLSYLAVDPANPSLILDTAEAALDAGRVDQIRALLDRLTGVDATLPRAPHHRSRRATIGPLRRCRGSVRHPSRRRPRRPGAPLQRRLGADEGW
ncbi:hypothetical protein [uncultured Sphingomonas sp.]|uniref:hypothetical protein n=1 Tax=uncultured Sphingomonas sp. TaxID=158754 RepID=UPI0030FC094B